MVRRTTWSDSARQSTTLMPYCALSEVIAEALQRFVAESEAKAAGQETFRFVVQWPDGDPERVAFRGRLLESLDIDNSDGVPVDASVYETQGGSFVLVLYLEDGSSTPWFYYATYKTLKEVAQDSEFAKFWRFEEEAVSWIDEVAIKRAKEASAETWID